jgi:xylulokinase
MFLNPVFRETLAGVTGASIELYDTDGSVGAAKGAGMGAGVYRNHDEAFASLEKLKVIEPDTKTMPKYEEAYIHWKKILEMYIQA